MLNFPESGLSAINLSFSAGLDIFPANSIVPVKEALKNCHFERGEKSMILIAKDSSLCSE
jgi:hypothetical protein